MNRMAVLRDRRLLAIVASFVLLGAAFAMNLVLGDHLARVAMRMLAGMDRLGPAGWAIFILLQALVALVGFLPASLLGLVAGVIYGPLLGFMLSAFGVIFGALGTFWLARSFLRDVILRLASRQPGFHRIDAAIAADGWRLVLLMRISPVMPFSLTSFALGLSGIAARTYLLGTLASLPALFVYVVLGAVGADGLVALRHGAHDSVLALLGLGILATVLLTLRIGQLIARALRLEPHAADEGSCGVHGRPR